MKKASRAPMRAPKLAKSDLVSVPQAAEVLGINRSTLSRHVARGIVRSHGGKVRVSEVAEDRAKNLDPAYRKPLPGTADKLSVAQHLVSAQPAADFEAAVLAFAHTFHCRLSPVLTAGAVAAGIPMKMVAALEAEAGADLMILVDQIASEMLGRKVDIYPDANEMALVDWRALAATAGEPFDENAWDRYVDERDRLRMSATKVSSRVVR